MPSHIQTGQLGEDAAVRFLLQYGYTILSRNWRHKKAEVDIIAEDLSSIIFIEVKTLHPTAYGEPEDRVDTKKEKMLAEAAEAWVFEHDTQKELRFDIIAVKMNTTGSVTIRHFRDAFYPFGEI